MNYAEKLRDPRWQKKRLEILERDNFCCRECGDKKTELHVHHLIYFSKTEPWDFPNCCLVTVCKNCHKTRQSFEQQWKSVASNRSTSFLAASHYLLSCILSVTTEDYFLSLLCAEAEKLHDDSEGLLGPKEMLDHFREKYSKGTF